MSKEKKEVQSKVEDSTFQKLSKNLYRGRRGLGFDTFPYEKHNK
jgi:hypothetical protein